MDDESKAKPYSTPLLDSTEDIANDPAFNPEIDFKVPKEEELEKRRKIWKSALAWMDPATTSPLPEFANAIQFMTGGAWLSVVVVFVTEEFFLQVPSGIPYRDFRVEAWVLSAVLIVVCLILIGILNSLRVRWRQQALEAVKDGRFEEIASIRKKAKAVNDICDYE